MKLFAFLLGSIWLFGGACIIGGLLVALFLILLSDNGGN
jgi:hypothetical protein